MTQSCEFLWYIPNDVRPGHRGDSVTAGHNSLDSLTSHALALERFGWKGALIGTGWGRPASEGVRLLRYGRRDDRGEQEAPHNCSHRPRTPRFRTGPLAKPLGKRDRRRRARRAGRLECAGSGVLARGAAPACRGPARRRAGRPQPRLDADRPSGGPPSRSRHRRSAARRSGRPRTARVAGPRHRRLRAGSRQDLLLPGDRRREPDRSLYADRARASSPICGTPPSSTRAMRGTSTSPAAMAAGRPQAAGAAGPGRGARAPGKGAPPACPAANRGWRASDRRSARPRSPCRRSPRAPARS